MTDYQTMRRRGFTIKAAPAVTPTINVAAPEVHVAAPEVTVEAPVVHVAAPQVHVAPAAGPEMQALAEAIKGMRPGQRPASMQMTVIRDHRSGLIVSARFTFDYEN